MRPDTLIGSEWAEVRSGDGAARRGSRDAAGAGRRTRARASGPHGGPPRPFLLAVAFSLAACVRWGIPVFGQIAHQGYGEALRNRWGFVLTTRRRKYFMMTTSALSAAQWMARIQQSAQDWKERQATVEAEAEAAAKRQSARRPVSQASASERDSTGGSTTTRSRPLTAYSTASADNAASADAESSLEPPRWSFVEMHLALAESWNLPTVLKSREPEAAPAMVAAS